MSKRKDAKASIAKIASYLCVALQNERDQERRKVRKKKKKGYCARGVAAGKKFHPNTRCFPLGVDRQD